MNQRYMRDGISYIANRYGRATCSNKYMKDYNKNDPSKYIMYLDANNLYSWAMSQYLPIGGFRWMTQKEIHKTNLASYKDYSKKGLIIEVDLEYPQELHDLHNDYALAAEKLKINENVLSEYCKRIKDKYNISIGQVHVLPYQNLQLYMDLGLKLSKLHRVLEFNQSPWLREYIYFNTQKSTGTQAKK